MLCRAAGGELEQIQLLLGHASVQTTERYLGTKQDLVHAPNDAIKFARGGLAFRGLRLQRVRGVTTQSGCPVLVINQLFRRSQGRFVGAEGYVCDDLPAAVR
jgi:hypothetical protein